MSVFYFDCPRNYQNKGASGSFDFNQTGLCQGISYNKYQYVNMEQNFQMK